MCSDGHVLRRIGLVAGAAALLVLLAGCVATPDRGDSRPLHLPIGIPSDLVHKCEQSAGLGDSAAATVLWRDSQGVHVQIGRAKRTGGGSGGGMSNTESALISCLTLASGHVDYPRDSAGLLLLWKYSSTVLWPCFAQHGVDVGPTPSRAAFLGGDPQQIDPFDLIRTSISDQLWAQLHRDCPIVPAYLTASKTATG
jgi:hypothetical protein